MTARQIVEILINCDWPVNIEGLLDEASVHLPNRSSRWVAAYRDASGRPVWRSTRLRDRKAAMLLAKRWELEARRMRATQGAPPRKPTVRVRAGSGEEAAGFLTQREVAQIMKISERSVREIEREAFEKLRRHPALRAFWKEWMTGEVEEAASGTQEQWILSLSEIYAIYALARTPEEQQLIKKLIALTQRGSH